MEEKQLALDLVKLMTEGKLAITLPVSKKSFHMKMASARTQLVAQRVYEPAKKPFEFMLETIRQCLDPQPTMDEMLDMVNPDLDFLQEVYSRINRTGKNGITENELDDFFKNPSSSTSQG
jgi:hypothetical protein